MGTFSTGTSPRAAAFDGSKIWIANSGQNTLTIIVPPESPGTPQLVAAAGSPTVVTQSAPTPSVSLVGMFHLLLSDE
jgi:hypothetical protein